MVALHLVLRPTPNGLGIVLKNLFSSLPSPTTLLLKKQLQNVEEEEEEGKRHK